MPNPQRCYDLAIVGGGINGCGIARDAAGRGYSVLLAEKDDLASATSSWSTKLIHGGLRYLEYYEFRLVREALKEREVLWNLAPHIIRPLRFILPHHSGLRPAWLLRLGLFLYDHLGGRKRLKGTTTLNLGTDPAGAPLKPLFRTGFEYSDCQVDDARLVVLTAKDAAERGAVIETRTEVVAAHRDGGAWVVTLRRRDTGAEETIRARMLINAAGPWVAEMLGRAAGVDSAAQVRMVQGSHIVVRRMFEHERAYIFQNADNRIIFAIPYQDDFTLIGTTDQDYRGDPGAVAITPAEIDYLCAAASEYFRKPVSRDDIVWSYSGVRPLYDDGATAAQAATRDYVLELDGEPGQPPLLSIFGGKITTYRKLAEAVLDRLVPYGGEALGAAESWSGDKQLPGGDFGIDEFETLLAGFIEAYPFLAPAHARRLLHAYGTRAGRVLGPARSAADLGRVFGADLTEVEVDYLRREEWAVTAADIVWRRSKLGLRLSAAEIADLDRWLAETAPVGASTVGASAVGAA